MKQSAVIGVDVGADGSIALITADEVIFYDHGRDYKGAYAFLSKCYRDYDILLTTIEEVRGIARTSRKATFTFGYVKGKTELLFDLLGKRLFKVSATKWQNHFYIKIPTQFRRMSKYRKKQIRKQLIADRALAVRPDIKSSIHTPRGRLLDGRTDALLIGLYGMKLKNLILEERKKTMSKQFTNAAALQAIAAIQTTLNQLKQMIETSDSGDAGPDNNDAPDSGLSREQLLEYLKEVPSMTREELDVIAKEQLGLSYRATLGNVNLLKRMLSTIETLLSNIPDDETEEDEPKEMTKAEKKAAKKAAKKKAKQEKKNLKEINAKSPWDEDENADDKKKSEDEELDEEDDEELEEEKPKKKDKKKSKKKDKKSKKKNKK